MRTARVSRPVGAEWRTETSPFGDQDLRSKWSQRVEALGTLDEAVAALVAFRKEHSSSLTDMNALWIEARLEERVAVMRFAERSYEYLRSMTLLDEPIRDVLARYQEAVSTGDAAMLESIAAEFRQRYKPPIMPSSPYLQMETLISEQLMKRRSEGWFDPTIAALRSLRGAKVLKEGWTDRDDRAPDSPRIS